MIFSNNVEKKTTIHIFHHNDLDGVTAGAVAYNYMNKMYNNNVDIKLYMIKNYNETIDISNIDTNIDIVYFLDYSFTNTKNTELLEELHDKRCNIIWIDHHKSSIEMRDKYTWMKELKGLIVDGICGAMLTYIYFNIAKFFEFYITDINNMRECEKLLSDNIDYYTYIVNNDNIYIGYVNDHDIFRNKLDNTREFSLGAFNLYGDPKNNNITEALFDDNNILPDVMVCTSIDIGKIIVNYNDNIDKANMSEMSYKTYIEYKGKIYNCICINRRGNSYTFGEDFKKYDICIMWYYNGDRYFYSLYTDSDDIDTSEISKAMGGGGHKKASGFNSDSLLFKKNRGITVTDK